MTVLYRWTDVTSIDKETYKKGDLDYSRMGNIKDHGKTVKGKIPSDKAFWVFDMSNTYRPAEGVVKTCILLKLTFTTADFAKITNQAKAINASGDTETKKTGNSSTAFSGEAQHPDDVLVKSNEKGAYGIGVNMLRAMHPSSIAPASDDEVKNALGDGSAKGKIKVIPAWYKENVKQW